MIRTLKIYWDYEDELEVYEISDGMLQASKIIYGVRMYPYIIFDNDEEVFLNTVCSEVITYNSDGTTEIIISEASIINELLQLFKNGNTVKQIIQNFILITDMEEHKEENWIYDNMEIKSAIITSQLDEISEFSVVLRNY